MRSWIALLLVVSTPCFAAPNPYGIPDEQDERLRKGFELLFKSDFKAAEEELRPLKESSAHYPLLALGDVVLRWWEMTELILETDETASRKFNEAAELALKLAQGKLEKDPKGQARLALGTTLSLMSRWSAANRAWVPAFLRGSKSASYLEQVLKRNPHAMDAYMALGTFNYAKSLLARRMKSETDASTENPNRDQALRQLKKAYREATYFRLPSGLLLAGILTNEAPKQALPLLTELRAALSESAFVHMIHLTALYNAGELDEMREQTDDFFRKIDKGAYAPLYKPQGYFARGLLAMREQQWTEARKEFDQAIRTDLTKNPYVTWSQLYKGYVYDAMGKHSLAKKQYEKVLKLPRRLSSHDHARNRLTTPFKPTDPEMKKVEL